MFRTIANAWKLKDLRNKILFTLAIILVYRIGACLPVPYVNSEVLSQTVKSSQGVLSLLNTLSGNSFAQGTLFALGVSPYITASIVVQLLTVAITRLGEWAKEGEEGKKKIDMLTKIVTVVLALITGIAYYLYEKGSHALIEESFFYAVVVIACYCAGASLVMWLASKIDAFGVGNGISIILFANIVSRGANLLLTIIEFFRMGGTVKGNTYDLTRSLRFFGAIVKVDHPAMYIITGILSVLFFVGVIWFIVFISNSERRIKVLYAKKTVGNKMYGGQKTDLPLKVDMTGVMPVIFATTILSIPSILAQMFSSDNPESGWAKFASLFSQTSWLYVVIYFIFVVAFAYFYAAITFDPNEVANRLKADGGTIQGIRPGAKTAEYIKKILSRITLIGALALSVVCIVPMIYNLIVANVFNMSVIYYLSFGGTSMIIVVGVVLETLRDIEAQMTMRHYKGILG